MLLGIIMPAYYSQYYSSTGLHGYVCAQKSTNMNDQRPLLTLNELEAELKQFYGGNPLNKSEHYPMQIMLQWQRDEEIQFHKSKEAQLIKEFNASLPSVLSILNDKVKSIKERFPLNFNSEHEMYGVLIEEVEELFHEIKINEDSRDLKKIRWEAMDVAAVCIRYIVEQRAKWGY